MIDPAEHHFNATLPKFMIYIWLDSSVLSFLHSSSLQLKFRESYL